MDSISVLLTSCIVIVLLALTTIKYAYIKLKKQSFGKGDIDIVEDEQLFNDAISNGTKLRNESANIKKSSSIFPSRKLTHPNQIPSKEEYLSAEKSVSNGSCIKEVEGSNFARPPADSYDQVDLACSRDTATVSSTLCDSKNEKEAKQVTEKVAQNGSVVRTKTTRIVYMNTKPTAADCLAENFIREIEMNVVPNADKSTLIIHAVQKAAQVDDNQNKDDEFEFDELPLPSLPENEQYNQEFLTNKPARKSKRGKLFRSLRHRLSKKHSYSVNTPSVWETEPNSKDIIKEKEDLILRCSVPEDSQGMPDIQLHSTRSSASELSAISRQSTATYSNENSTLVIEVYENQVRKFYLVPPHLIESGKWRKQGKKLHIYNEHSFVAKHISSGKYCEICNERIPFSLGKQAYKCRDCKMICHKECHVRTPAPCPNTSVYDFELPLFY